jgi:hypothetical protein
MMDEQRSSESSRPKEERVHIGGEIQICHLSREGFHVYMVDRFEDYERDKKAIYENFRTRKNSG